MHQVFKSFKNAARRPAGEVSQRQRRAGAMMADSAEAACLCRELVAGNWDRSLL